MTERIYYADMRFWNKEVRRFYWRESTGYALEMVTGSRLPPNSRTGPASSPQTRHFHQDQDERADLGNAEPDIPNALAHRSYL